MKSFDFFELLGDVPEDLVESCFAAPAVPEHRIPRPWLRTCLAAGTAAAACIAAVAGTAFLLHDDGLTQQSSNLEAVMQEVVTEPAQTAAAPVQTAPAASAPPEETPAVPAQTAAAVPEPAPAVTEAAADPSDEMPPVSVTEQPAAPAPAETAPAEPAETLPPAEPAEAAETEPAPAQPVFEPGDVDMDGKITFVDAALVMVDINLARCGGLEESMMTEEQRALGNVNGLDDGSLLNQNLFSGEDTVLNESDYLSFALSNEDYWGIYYTALYRNWYGIDFSPADYFRYCEEHPDYTNTEIGHLGDYRDDLEITRSDMVDAIFLHLKMCMALTGHKPLDPHRILDDNGELLIGELYSEEDFWDMAEELLTYFEDTAEVEGG